MFLVNSRLGQFTAAIRRWHPFSLSYGVVLPSSLTKVLPRVLEFSSCQPVSVLVRVLLLSIASFLGSMKSLASLLIFQSSSQLSLMVKGICLSYQPYCLNTHPIVCKAILLRQHICQTTISSTGISTCCPSPTPFGLSLGPDLPWGDEPCSGNLGFSTGEILTHLLATHASILSCVLSTLVTLSASTCTQCSSTDLESRSHQSKSFLLLFRWNCLISLFGDNLYYPFVSFRNLNFFVCILQNTWYFQ